MAYKVHIIGNVFLVDDLTGSTIRAEGLAKNVLPRVLTPDSSDFGFDNLNNWDKSRTLSFSDIDLTGAPYTDLATFKTWLYDELGKSSPQEGGIKSYGFIDYNDLNTSTTPINVIGGGGFVYLTNDELGAFTNKLYPPDGVTDVWDASNNRFDFSQLNLGSKLDYRLDIEITTTSNNQEIDVEIELAIGGSSYSLGVANRQYKSVRTYKLDIENYVYMGDLNTRDNYAKFKIKSDGNATVKVNGWACYIFMY